MRDHSKLRAFELADDLALQVYRETKGFPKQEQFGLTSQMRRAAVSVPSNIVEGCARHTETEYLHFLDWSQGSLTEVRGEVSDGEEDPEAMSGLQRERIWRGQHMIS